MFGIDTTSSVRTERYELTAAFSDLLLRTIGPEGAREIASSFAFESGKLTELPACELERRLRVAACAAHEGDRGHSGVLQTRWGGVTGHKLSRAVSEFLTVACDATVSPSVAELLTKRLRQRTSVSSRDLVNGFRLAAKVVEDTRTGLETNIISGRRDLASIAQWKAQWKLEKVARGIYNVLVPRGQWEASVMKLDSEWRAKNGTGLLSGPRQYLHNLIAETFWRAKQMDRAGIECVNIIPNVERWDDGLRGKVTRATFENKLRLLAGHSDRLTLANPVAYIIACGTLLFNVSDFFNRGHFVMLDAIKPSRTIFGGKPQFCVVDLNRYHGFYRSNREATYGQDVVCAASLDSDR